MLSNVDRQWLIWRWSSNFFYRICYFIIIKNWKKKMFFKCFSSWVLNAQSRREFFDFCFEEVFYGKLENMIREILCSTLFDKAEMQ